MRNACRKDDSRGGIRQCANSKFSAWERVAEFVAGLTNLLSLVMCGKWESFPREFAKCRRCRKAKYCGKECQSTAWSEGHRFWCSAKDPEEEGDHVQAESTRARANAAATTNLPDVNAGVPVGTNVVVTNGGTVTGRAERRAERDRERQARAREQIIALRTNPTIAPSPTRRDRNVDGPGPANPTPTTVSPTDASRWTTAHQARTRARDDVGTSQTLAQSGALAQGNTERRMQDTAVAALDIDQLNPHIRRDILALMARLPNGHTSPGAAGPSRTQQDGDDDMVIE